MSHPRMAAPAVLLAGLMAAGPVLADKHEPPAVGFSAAVAAEARHLVENAASVAHKMASDERVADLLAEAKGVFIVPNLLKGGFVVGGRGGEGVLLVRNNETWSNPAFFSLGALTLGAQAGSAEGPLAMLLMSDEAVRSFWRDDSFALDASAGLSIYRYDLLARAETGKGDVIVWSDQGGAFAGATVGASGISIDQDKNHAYYTKPVDLQAILEGKVENPHPKRLQKKLPGGA